VSANPPNHQIIIPVYACEFIITFLCCVFSTTLQCYFILSASPAIPILYYVERLRDGKTYCTRSVKAVQNGKVVFTLLCSFQKPEPHQPSHQLSLPIAVPRPDKCQSMADRFRAAAEEPGLHPKRKAACLELAHVRA
jgi:acyl-CoA thioesterase II